MKVGKSKEGIRWHPSYDVNHVRTLVEQKIKKKISMAAVKLIEVDIVSHTANGRSETKNLSFD
ncbi:MAG TPA: hypothetical protein VKI61_02875 [Chitinophagaceae bacterium]|jgi:hypothetical protein|nr:hypothetical protein [Chitinophagaceae bacterium]